MWIGAICTLVILMAPHAAPLPGSLSRPGGLCGKNAGRKRVYTQRRRNPRTATPRKTGRNIVMRNSQVSRAFAVPGLLACMLLAGTTLALTTGASRGQDAAATDEWKVDPMRG